MALAVSLDQIAQVASAEERARLQALLFLSDENSHLKEELETLRAGAKLLTAANDELSRVQQREAVALERKAYLVRVSSWRNFAALTDAPRLQVERRVKRRLLRTGFDSFVHCLLDSRREAALERALAVFTKGTVQSSFSAWQTAVEASRSREQALARVCQHTRQRAVLDAWRGLVARRAHLAWTCIRVVTLRRTNSLRIAFDTWCAFIVRRRLHRKALAAARRLRLRRVVVEWRLFAALELSRRWAQAHDADGTALAAARADVEELRQRLASSQLLVDDCRCQQDAAHAALLRAELRSPATPGVLLLDTTLRFSMVTPSGMATPPRRGDALCPVASVMLSDDGTYEDAVLVVVNPAQPSVSVLRRPLGVDVSPDLVVAGGTLLEWMPCAVDGMLPPPCCTEWAACGMRTHGVLCFGGFDGHGERNECYLLARRSQTASLPGEPAPVQHFQWLGPLAATAGVPSPRSHATLTPTPSGTLAYLFGGHSSASGALNELWCVTLSRPSDGALPEATWYRPDGAGQPPSPRTGHAACVSPHDGCLYIFGGLALGPTGARVLNDLHRFDPSTGGWEALRPWGAQPPPRRLHAMCAIGSHLVIHGGTTDGDGQELYNPTNGDVGDCFSLDLASMTWRAVPLAGSSPGAKAPSRSAHVMVVTTGGSLLAVGGVVNGRLAHNLAPCCIENASAAEGLALRREAVAASKAAAVSSASRRDAVASAAAALAQGAAARREALNARADADDAQAQKQAATEALHALADRVRVERARRKQATEEAGRLKQQIDALVRELQRRTAALESAVSASDADAASLAEALASRDLLLVQLEALRRERDAAGREALVASAAAAAAEAAKGAAELRAEQARHALFQAGVGRAGRLTTAS